MERVMVPWGLLFSSSVPLPFSPSAAPHLAALFLLPFHFEKSLSLHEVLLLLRREERKKEEEKAHTRSSASLPLLARATRPRRLSHFSLLFFDFSLSLSLSRAPSFLL